MMTVKNRRYHHTGLVIASSALLSALVFGSALGDWGAINAGLIPTAQAQSPADADVSDADVSSYAQAVVAIEEQRLAAYESASDILAAAGDEEGLLKTELSCQAHKLSDMPDIPKADKVDLLTVLVDFCAGARTSAEENDLTPAQFNSITAAQKEDADLAKRIQTTIGEL